MSHIIRSNAGKKIDTISELFIKQKIVFNFVYFSSSHTLIFLVPTHYRMTFRFRSFHQCNRKEEEKKWIKDMHQNQDAFGQEASAALGGRSQTTLTR